MKIKLSSLYLLCLIVLSFNSKNDSSISDEVLGCGISTRTYQTALSYVANYQENYLADSRLGFLAPDHVQYADNQHVCFSKALEKTRDAFPGLGGTQFLYGLKDPTDFRTSQRIGVFLPLDSSGDRLTLSNDTDVFIMKLPTEFHDPCPDWCDY